MSRSSRASSASPVRPNSVQSVLGKMELADDSADILLPKTIHEPRLTRTTLFRKKAGYAMRVRRCGDSGIFNPACIRGRVGFNVHPRYVGPKQNSLAGR